MESPPSPSLFCPFPGIFQYTKKLFLREQAGRAQAVEFVRKNVANCLSIVNLIVGLSSIICSLNGYVGSHSEWECFSGLLGPVLLAHLPPENLYTGDLTRVFPAITCSVGGLPLS